MRTSCGNYILGAERSELRSRLKSGPKYDEADRDEPVSERLRKLHSLADVFVPTMSQLRFAEELRACIIEGDRRRELIPFSEEPFELCPDYVASEKNRRSYAMKLPNSSADCSDLACSVLAIPGLGKSTTAANALALIPQRHAGIPDCIGVTWLKLTCPPNSDLKAFCCEFIDQMAMATGSPRIRTIFNHAATPEKTMAKSVISLSRAHGLGCLIVDDIQNLPTAGANSGRAILGLLRSLGSEAGVPVICLGTMAAAELLQNELQSAISSVSIAGDIWEPLCRGAPWDQFMDELWVYQWTASKTDLTAELREVFYEHSQGVMGIAVKLYHRVQAELIKGWVKGGWLAAANTGTDATPELIEVEFVESMSDFFFKPIHAHLDAIRSRDPAKLAGFEDLKPLRTEARRMEAERIANVAATDDDQNGEVDTSKLVDASDDQLTKHITDKEQLKKSMQSAATAILLAAHFDVAKAAEIRANVENNITGGFHNYPRKFFRNLELRILEEEKARKAECSKPRRTPTDDDLDAALAPGADIGTILKESGFGLVQLLAKP